MATEVLMTISKDEIERARLESELKYELDMQSLRVHAKKEGRKEGLEEGRKEGKLEGRNEVKKEMVDLLKSGKSLDEILAVLESPIP